MAVAESLREQPGRSEGTWVAAPLAVAPHALVARAAATVPVGLGTLFLFFLKVGSVLFGSGYVLLAFLKADLVVRWGWLTEGQLLDAVAVGQMTPGPVFATATFIGYILSGVSGAVVATVGIFLPSLIFVALIGKSLPRVRRSRMAGAFLDGVNVASLALLAGVTWELGQAAIINGTTAGLAVASGVLLANSRLNLAWRLLAGAANGLAVGGALTQVALTRPTACSPSGPLSAAPARLSARSPPACPRRYPSRTSPGNNCGWGSRAARRRRRRPRPGRRPGNG